MSGGINLVIVSGNLAADPELRMTQGGQAVCKLRLAVTTSWQGNEGRKERTEWVSVVVWGAQGQACANFLRKGSGVLVEGELNTRTYDKNGEKRYSTEVRARAAHFLGSREKPPGQLEHEQVPRDNRRRQQRPPQRVQQEDMEYPTNGGQVDYLVDPDEHF